MTVSLCPLNYLLGAEDFKFDLVAVAGIFFKQKKKSLVSSIAVKLIDRYTWVNGREFSPKRKHGQSSLFLSLLTT